MNKPVVGRFAPSPSGYLHMGNLLSLLLAWLDCRSLGGELIFRLEDLDPGRSKKEYSEAIISDLRWLGLDWDRGYPAEPQYAQSARTELYEAAFPKSAKRAAPSSRRLPKSGRNGFCKWRNNSARAAGLNPHGTRNVALSKRSKKSASAGL